MRRYGRTPKLSSLADSTLNHILLPCPFFLLPLTSLILSYPLITLIKRKYTKNFFPFSLNPRNCIGMKFATNEAIMLIASIVQNFDLRIFSSSSPPLHPSTPHPFITSLPLHPFQFCLFWSKDRTWKREGDLSVWGNTRPEEPQVSICTSCKGINTSSPSSPFVFLCMLVRMGSTCQDENNIHDFEM